MIKKILFLFLIILLTINISLATCKCDNKNNEQSCDKCTVEDDEYCIFNQCYFNKHYRIMKINLQLDEKQECAIDTIYKNFKIDMENEHLKYQNEKNKLLEMIECEDKCYKKQLKVVKEIKENIKNKYRDFKDAIVQELNKCQKRKLNKFIRYEKRKYRKLNKYGKILKLPCIDCCKRKK